MRISMHTGDVLSLLNKHKDNHINVFAEQMIGWKLAMENYTKSMNQWAYDGGNSNDRPKEPLKPVDYIDSYNNLIEMIEYHIDSSIYLDDDGFKSVVKDKFGWSSHFLSNSVAYAS